MSLTVPSCLWEPCKHAAHLVHSCVGVYSVDRIHPHFSYFSFLWCSPENHLVCGPTHIRHQEVSRGTNCLISYLGMPAARHQEIWDKWHVMAAYAWGRETLFPVKAELGATYQLGYGEKHLFFFRLQKGSLYRQLRMGSQVTFRLLCSLLFQPFSFM